MLDTAEDMTQSPVKVSTRFRETYIIFAQAYSVKSFSCNVFGEGEVATKPLSISIGTSVGINCSSHPSMMDQHKIKECL